MKAIALDEYGSADLRTVRELPDPPVGPDVVLGGSYVFVTPSTADLSVLAGLVDVGRLTVHVARTFPLDQAADAHRLVETGHVRGKVVLEM
ncbi:zinc-binding dehydrogenase [Micromonospora thermarum]|uniref:zinc-binding dehydrogenase n=1 Tax=Micromonospora thermarum TaxID=2720024 RepID=UPI00281667A6|nr:zinc-binding dehydrogenase [Micromonospora thermarum]